MKLCQISMGKWNYAMYRIEKRPKSFRLLKTIEFSQSKNSHETPKNHWKLKEKLSWPIFIYHWCNCFVAEICCHRMYYWAQTMIVVQFKFVVQDPPKKLCELYIKKNFACFFKIKKYDSKIHLLILYWQKLRNANLRTSDTNSLAIF